MGCVGKEGRTLAVLVGRECGYRKWWSNFGTSSLGNSTDVVRRKLLYSGAPLRSFVTAEPEVEQIDPVPGACGCVGKEGRILTVLVGRECRYRKWWSNFGTSSLGNSTDVVRRKLLYSGAPLRSFVTAEPEVEKIDPVPGAC